jgi:hypothetical protein
VPDQPAEQLAGAVGDIAGHVAGFEIEALGSARDHGLGCLDLLGDPRRRRLHVDNLSTAE